MFERFDSQATFAMDRAFAEANAFGHDQVGTEHLLLGLLSVGSGPAADALIACGATLDGCRAKVVEAAATKRGAASSPELGLTDRAARALERATRLSLRELSDYVTPEHVLVSVLDVEGTAGQVLRGLSVEPARVREAVESAAQTGTASYGEVPAASPEAVAAPYCPRCGADLASTLAHTRVSSSGGDGVTIRWLVAYCSSCGAAIGGYQQAH